MPQSMTLCPADPGLGTAGKLAMAMGQQRDLQRRAQCGVTHLEVGPGRDRPCAQTAAPYDRTYYIYAGAVSTIPRAGWSPWLLSL